MGWLADLDSYDFGIKYRSGKSSVNADVLSRYPADNRSVLPSKEVHVMLNGVICNVPRVVPLLVEEVFTFIASLLDTD